MKTEICPPIYIKFNENVQQPKKINESRFFKDRQYNGKENKGEGRKQWPTKSYTFLSPLKQPSSSISRCWSRYEASLTLSVVSFISRCNQHNQENLNYSVK